ncbi:hypothetical protein [Compostimonas suwonensis]|uniref:DUF7882 domain-containing protein n=1 Tax=Compostimonas suwonensis TaxID=1048394 RepID=A0A2M9C3P4_9MICO|nr:hypothetical protein [Compostimonas suwonensis]PJJ65077.1 hypothetical protein CLV54_0104 [Compostimonas suwonensis]
MGVLVYNGEQFAFDDRLLSHLKLVMVQKMRRDEGFLLSWSYSLEQGSGRSSIWIHGGANLHFRFDGSRPATLNKEWMDRMIIATHTTGGLVLEAVPEEPRTE